MCCLFGLYDYGGTLSAKQKNRMIAALAAASEVRGIDATGIAYCMNGHLSVYKRPLPAHWMRFRIPEQAAAVMGHTRMTTQGSEYRNYNNHPFSGKAGQPFALAHNGVLTNDGLLRRQEKLPVSKIETDSFIIVQLLEQAGSIGFQTLRTASEQLAGSFTYMVLDGGGRLYIVRGNNPFCLYHWPEQGLYLYASTQAVLDAAVFKIRKLLSGSMQKIPVEEGEILRLSPDGSRASETFSMKSSINSSSASPRITAPAGRMCRTIPATPRSFAGWPRHSDSRRRTWTHCFAAECCRRRLRSISIAQKGGKMYGLVCARILDYSCCDAAQRLSACRKMINLAAISNALSALLKGALLALELLGSYDAEK